MLPSVPGLAGCGEQGTCEGGLPAPHPQSLPGLLECPEGSGELRRAPSAGRFLRPLQGVGSWEISGTPWAVAGWVLTSGVQSQAGPGLVIQTLLVWGSASGPGLAAPYSPTGSCGCFPRGRLSQGPGAGKGSPHPPVWESAGEVSAPVRLRLDGLRGGHSPLDRCLQGDMSVLGLRSLAPQWGSRRG